MKRHQDRSILRLDQNCRRSMSTNCSSDERKLLPLNMQEAPTKSAHLRTNRRRCHCGLAEALNFKEITTMRLAQESAQSERCTTPSGNGRTRRRRGQVGGSSSSCLPINFVALSIGLVINVLFCLCANSLKVTVSIPELVKLNDAFWLNCSYNNNNNQQQQQLRFPPQSTALFNNNNNNQQADNGRQASASERIYSIKWYKDEEEFYRYLPSAEPKVSIYETNGISLDQTKSHEGNVYMTKADVNSEGVYRCEVLSEAPLFETVRKSKHLRVYALPIRGPRIEILDSNGRIKNPKAQEISYEVGDKIELRCNSAPSKPAARLRWYLNDRELIVPSQPHTVITNDGAPTHDQAPRTSAGTGFLAPAMPINSQQQQQQQQQSLGYNVKVTPIEYRQHYKNIYSSHSTLSLILQRDDLVNSRISFKCLASMRQEVPIASKQLFLLTPEQPQSASSNLVQIRARSTRELLVNSNNNNNNNYEEAEPTRGPHQRHRAQYNRGMSGQSAQGSGSGSGSSRQRQVGSDVELINGHMSQDEARQLQSTTMMYIYEAADSTLGPSIIDGPETLERYLAASSGNLDVAEETSSGGSSSSSNNNNNYSLGNNYSLEFNRMDNLEYVQLMRDKLARQRSYPSASSLSTSSGVVHSLTSAGATGTGLSGGISGISGHNNHHKRLYGPNSLVKSPLYLDEYDPFRPVISWPPFESGKLMLLPPGNSIVAIPTSRSATPSSSSGSPGSEMKFVMPPSRGSSSGFGSASSSSLDFNTQQQQVVSQIILEKLIENLNCTCTEASIDTKLSWFVNELPLNSRDTRHYPNRISADHRQTWTTIGLLLQQQQHQQQFAPPPHQQSMSSSSVPASLATILARYYKASRAPILTDTTPAAVAKPLTGGRSGAMRLQVDTLTSNNHNHNHNHNQRILGSRQQQQQVPSGSGGGASASLGNSEQQIKFMCQAIHSLLLYSSSEMITFDFNPPPVNQADGNSDASNSIDKFSSLPSNVIPAATASPTRSASSSPSWKCFTLISLGSQQQQHQHANSKTTLLLLAMIAIKSLICLKRSIISTGNVVKFA